MSQYKYSNTDVRVKLDYYWRAMWQGLGLAGTGNTTKFDIIGNYEQRSYHNIQHLLEMLVQFQNFKPYLGNKYEVLAAIWFHDAIYEPNSEHNEERSADWAFQVTKNHKIPEIIMMSNMDDYDTAMFHDFDYAILAAPWERFVEYDTQVRTEYAKFPDSSFNPARVRFLEDMLTTRIFENYKFVANHEARAKENIKRILKERYASAN